MRPCLARSRRLSTMLGLSLVAAACGGATDNSDLFQKSEGSSSGSSSPAPTPPGNTTPLPPSTPTPPPTPPTVKPCAVSFAKDVLSVLSASGCARAQCHGAPAFRNEPTIDPAQSALTYKNLVTYEIDGFPYVAAGREDPDESSITCNLRGDCGTPMPLDGRLSNKQLGVIDAWLSCGAPFN